MTTTQISIINHALALIGANQITTLEDGTLEADTAAQMYDEIVEGELSSYPWKFATTDYSLGVPTGNTPTTPNWEREHTLPNNTGWIRHVRLSTSEYPIEYERFGLSLYTNVGAAEIVIINMTADVPEEQWPGYFKLYMRYLLAAEFAGPVTENDEVQERWFNKAKDAFIRAKQADRTNASAATRRFRPGRFVSGRR